MLRSPTGAIHFRRATMTFLISSYTSGGRILRFTRSCLSLYGRPLMISAARVRPMPFRPIRSFTVAELISARPRVLVDLGSRPGGQAAAETKVPSEMPVESLHAADEPAFEQRLLQPIEL